MKHFLINLFIIFNQVKQFSKFNFKGKGLMVNNQLFFVEQVKLMESMILKITIIKVEPNQQ